MPATPAEARAHASEAEQVLSQPDTREAMGIRDRAMLEVLYSTGIRRMEVVALRSTTSTPSEAR